MHQLLTKPRWFLPFAALLLFILFLSSCTPGIRPANTKHHVLSRQDSIFYAQDPDTLNVTALTSGYWYGKYLDINEYLCYMSLDIKVKENKIRGDYYLECDRPYDVPDIDSDNVKGQIEDDSVKMTLTSSVAPNSYLKLEGKSFLLIRNGFRVFDGMTHPMGNHKVLIGTLKEEDMNMFSSGTFMLWGN